MVEQQRARIQAVLGIEFDDLELGQQQVRERERFCVGVEAIRETDRMAHAECSDEHVELAPVVAVEEEQPAVPVHHVEARVRPIASGLEKRGIGIDADTIIGAALDLT